MLDEQIRMYLWCEFRCLNYLSAEMVKRSFLLLLHRLITLLCLIQGSAQKCGMATDASAGMVGQERIAISQVIRAYIATLTDVIC